MNNFFYFFIVIFSWSLFFKISFVESNPLWGFTGHQLTALIAQDFLEPSTLKSIQFLLPEEEGQISLVANWADQIKSDPAWKWSSNLHFINTPSWQCSFIPSQDCVKNQCVSGAITNYTNILSNSLSYDAQVIALKFLVHFHGDIHQPLHCGFAADRGGNDISGTFMGSGTNLHSVWDTALISNRISKNFKNDMVAYKNYLVSQIQTNWTKEVQTWTTCKNSNDLSCPDEWGNDSAKIACQYVYQYNGANVKTGFSFSDSYWSANKLVEDKQLAKGGVRLARTLNQIFG